MDHPRVVVNRSAWGLDALVCSALVVLGPMTMLSGALFGSAEIRIGGVVASTAGLVLLVALASLARHAEALPGARAGTPAGPTPG